MSAVLTPPEEESTINQASEKRFVLDGISWKTYEQLLSDFESRSAPRFTYDNGVLEIMSPLADHENVSDALRDFIYFVAMERRIDAKCLGSNTFKLEALEKGAEPDACFYFANARLVRNVKKIDLDVHPAPELVIEVDYTSPSIDKFPIYAAIGVTEIWHYKDDEVKFFHLDRNQYVEISESVVLPKVTATDVTRFLYEGRTKNRIEWLESVREWLHSL